MVVRRLPSLAPITTKCSTGAGQQRHCASPRQHPSEQRRGNRAAKHGSHAAGCAQWMNMRRPGMVRNNSSAYRAQSTAATGAFPHARPTGHSPPGMLRPTGLWATAAEQPSLSRMGMLRQPQQPTTQMAACQNTRGFSTAQTTRSTRLGPQLTRSNLSSCAFVLQRFRPTRPASGA